MSVVRKTALVCCLIGASTALSAEESPNLIETITAIDTSIPFAPGAEEHFINVRGPFGQPSFQQGFVEGMHYRIDPDGGALFSRDPRLRNNVFEVECEDGIASCIAIRGVVRLSIDTEGLLVFGLDADSAFDAIYVGYGSFDADQPEGNWKKLNTSLDTVSVDILAGYDQMVVVKDGKLAQQIPLEGILVVGAYLKWVVDGQPVKVLPASWEDAHEDAPNQIHDANLAVSDSFNFQSEFKNDWATYSPLLQFDDAGFENSHEGGARYGDPELGLGTAAQHQVNDVIQVDMNNTKDSIPTVIDPTVVDPTVVDIEQDALEPVIDLAKLSLDELAKLQLQFDGSLQPDSNLIDVVNVEDNSAADLNSYVNNLNVVLNATKSEPDLEFISVLMTSISEPFNEQPTNEPQSMEAIVEPVSSAKPEEVLVSLIKPKRIELSKSDEKKKKPEIGGNICKPAILATVEENVIIKKALQNKELQSKSSIPTEFSDPSEALKDLPGIYVFTDYLAEPVHLKDKFNGAIHDEIEARLKAGGIRVITKEELPNVPGQPRMEVYFSKANVETGCSFAVWISVRQTMLLGRDQEILLLSGTWGSGGAHLREYSDAPEFNTIMNHVDRFVADYKKANSKPNSSFTQ